MSQSVSSAGVGRALVIGIDEYPRFGATEQLFGAVADAEAMADWLVSAQGFDRRRIRLLRNDRAGRQAILDAMDHLCLSARRGDHVVFYFSGHGSQMTDREGDEGDGLDETLVPSDSGRDPLENRDITDDEIHLWSRKILAVTTELWLIFDCCHSGTLHRPGRRTRAVPPDLRPISELPPSPVPSSEVRRDLRAPTSALQLSAGRDQDKAWEIPSPYDPATIRGAFTLELLRAVEGEAARATWRQILQTVTRRLVELGLDQQPIGSGRAFDLERSERDARRGSVAWKRLLESSAAEADRLRGTFEWRLFRSGVGPWTPADPEKLRIGDRLRFDVWHRHRRALYVYLLDFGTTGHVELVFPEAHGQEALDPGIRLRIGARREDRLELVLPEDSAEPPHRGSLILIGSQDPLSVVELLSPRSGFLDRNDLFLLTVRYRLS